MTLIKAFQDLAGLRVWLFLYATNQPPHKAVFYCQNLGGAMSNDPPPEPKGSFLMPVL